MYSQAAVLVRQETEALRISSEQLQVLGQLVTELERLEALHHENADGPLPGPEAQTQDQIPAGSPDLPDGVAIPPGWTLMPLQRLDNQHRIQPTSTQRSSRASSAGPATSSLGEERTPHTPTSHPAPTSQPTQRSNVPVLERIPGTNNFRLAGSNNGGAAPRPEPTAVPGDAPAVVSAAGSTRSSEGSDSRGSAALEDEDEGPSEDEAEFGESSKAAGKAVTMEDVSEEE
ncbi:RING finger protein [Cordyceps fumosorosea ARSEF 2679]|uniref:RING finger protein n=1 Tax=Cordyceps fumosorosea (strain ARSEF 2679) TaxID=1081104 RepID=A0A167YCV7_CORFA|nr:RING finger protein [Cordyceps fumosorosea ARSEF 2679]OAA66183.1 RING finger protein [Cordyceps fumosorosea ARSEF 2679]